MNITVIAVGNVLMKDDGVGIEVAREIEGQLRDKRIQVIYGETDVNYCLSQIYERNYVILLDAGGFGKRPGRITQLELGEVVRKKNATQHSITLLALMKLYYPSIKGLCLVIEGYEIEMGIGLSSILQDQIKEISKEIVHIIDEILLKDKEKPWKENLIG